MRGRGVTYRDRELLDARKERDHAMECANVLNENQIQMSLEIKRLKAIIETMEGKIAARKPPAAVSAIRSAIARAAWGKLSADERKARQQRVWAKRKAAANAK